MYKILSFPSDILAGNKIIDFSENIASPPDFEDWFEERRYHYSTFGLTAYKLAEELCLKYGIKMKTYNDWNPEAEFERVLKMVTKKRQKRLDKHKAFVDKVFDDKEDKQCS